jgi:predicted Zn-dependent protease with MMP-like domain
MDPIPLERFERLVDEALDDVPDELWAQFENVAVLVEDEDPDEPELLGIYEGIPLTERDEYGGALPDVIRIFRLPLCRMCEDEDHLVDEVYVTVVHEFAHHLGIDDDRLHELGWA